MFQKGSVSGENVCTSSVTTVDLPTKHFMLLSPLLQNLSRAVESESEGILGGIGVGKNVPTPTPTSV
jgi:hypothetical protein